MNHTRLLRAILPDVLTDDFDVAKFEKTDLRFDIWLDEKKVQMREDKKNGTGHRAGDEAVDADARCGDGRRSFGQKSYKSIQI